MAPSEPGASPWLDEIEAGRVRRVLVARPGRVGDVLVIVPALRALVERHPGLELTLWTSDYALPVVEPSSLFGGRFIVSEHRVSRWRRPLQNRKIVREIRELAPDLAIVLSARRSDRRTVERAGVPRIYPPAGTEISGEATQSLHVVEEVFRALGPLGIRGEPGPLELEVEENDTREAGRLLEEQGVSLDAPFALLHPGCHQLHRRGFGTHSRRRLWPIENFEALARRLQEEARLPVVLSGHGEKETAMIRSLVTRLPGPTVDGSALGLETLAACLRRASVVVTLDTGPLHMAAALGAPLVTLFGPSSPVHTGPWKPGPHRILYRGLDCSPCRGRHVPCSANICMTGIEVDEVYRACREVSGLPGSPAGEV